MGTKKTNLKEVIKYCCLCLLKKHVYTKMLINFDIGLAERTLSLLFPVSLLYAHVMQYMYVNTSYHLNTFVHCLVVGNCEMKPAE